MSDHSASKSTILSSWHQTNQHFYDYAYQNPIDYPVTSCQWGPILSTTQQYHIQKLYFSCRTGSQFSTLDNHWKGAPNHIAIATVEIPNLMHYFIPELRAVFGNGDGKMFHNLKIKTYINHPGEVTTMRAFPLNRKVFTTKNQANQVFLWTNDRYKQIMNGYAHTPQVTLLTNKSSEPNFALSFAATFPRIATSSGNKIEVFDLESATSRKEFGSVSSNSMIAPTISLEVCKFGEKEKIEDIAFKEKSNEICAAGGIGRRLGRWDLRIGKNIDYVEQSFTGDIHSISWKENLILTGCSDGKLNIVDDRMTKTFLFSHQTPAQILSVRWSPQNKFFGVGSDNLYFYDYNDVEQTKEFKPRFTHSSMRGPINDFDWNFQNSWNVISTCHEADSGGSLHVFRPLDIFYLDREEAKERLGEAMERLGQEQQSEYL